MAHTCDAVVVTCIDFRFQEKLEAWIHENVCSGKYDRVSWAGGVKNWEQVAVQIELSKKLHGIHKAILINHEDCGAYGAAGTLEKHTQDLHAAKAAVLAQFPDLSVDLYFAKLDGNIEKIT